MRIARIMRAVSCERAVVGRRLWICRSTISKVIDTWNALCLTKKQPSSRSTAPARTPSNLAGTWPSREIGRAGAQRAQCSTRIYANICGGSAIATKIFLLQLCATSLTLTRLNKKSCKLLVENALICGRSRFARAVGWGEPTRKEPSDFCVSAFLHKRAQQICFPMTFSMKLKI